MKKILLLMISMLFLSSCAVQENSIQNDKIKITATIFPQYDFSRQIAKDLADINMLLPIGGESHTYEPTPKDILTIENSDIFIYTGGESDAWIEDIIKNINNKDLKVVCLSKICNTLPVEHSHNNSVHTIDEHVWTSPKNAILISEEITKVLCEIDTKNEEVYKGNFEIYKNELLELDNTFKEISENAKRNTLIFGDRFPFRYLTEEYGFNYLSAFPGCSEDSEPDVKTIKSLIDKVHNEKIPIVFYVDFSNNKIAETICDETDAKVSMLRSCHTVTKEEFENNTTYLDLMYMNTEKLKEALN